MEMDRSTLELLDRVHANWLDQPFSTVRGAAEKIARACLTDTSVIGVQLVPGAIETHLRMVADQVKPQFVLSEFLDIARTMRAILEGVPGEPLIELGMAIQSRSPFSHTLVLGYANGPGVGYVGM